MEAKMLADTDVPTVGIETDLIVVQPDGKSFRVNRPQLKHFRTAWERRKNNPPKSLLAMLAVEPLHNF
jgi:hypothetical protein